MSQVTGGSRLLLLPPTNSSRTSFPKYGYLLFPRTEQALRTIDIGAALAISAGLFFLTHAVGNMSTNTIAVMTFVAFGLTLSGTKVGQTKYSEELQRSQFLGGLLGTSTPQAYAHATSHRGLQRALVTGAALTLWVDHDLAGFSFDARALCYAILIGALAVAGFIGYQCAAQSAVALNAFRLPQYAYLVFSACVVAPSVITGLHLAAHQSVQHETLSWELLLGCLAGCAVAICALLAVHARLIQLLTSSGTVSVAIDLPRSRRRLPLPLRMWSARGRAYGSVIMGLTAITVALLVWVPGALARGTAAMPGFKQVDLAVVIVYATIFVAMSIAEAPLELKLVAARRWLLDLSGSHPKRELRSATGFLIWVGAAAGVLSIVTLRQAVPAVAQLNPVTCGLSVAALVLGAAALVVPHDGRAVGPTDLNPMRILRTAFVALLAACMVVGHEAADRPGAVGLLVGWLAMVGCLTYLALSVRKLVS